ncbi:Uma2 family endonuclease [Nostoc sp.]|uniref:Uma2 family endonuclease n=1 Tax=Nostoc sp. TaxID=1180 RepID=UPI002FF575F9
MEVWLVDINEQIIEVYQQPTTARYQLMQKFANGQTLSIKAFPNVNITVNEMFGR